MYTNNHGQPWKVLIRIHSKRSFGIIGTNTKQPIHAITLIIMTTLFGKCSIAGIQTKWDMPATGAVAVVNPEKSPFPVSRASA